MKTRVLYARVTFRSRPFVKPLQLSTGRIAEITEAQAQVGVRVGGKEAVGRGAIYLSDLWAWPDPNIPHAQRDARMRALCEQIAQDLPVLCGEEAHPLELGLRLHHQVCAERAEPPVLARAICCSPFDAAIHDGAGIALGQSAFAFYDGRTPLPSADSLFPDRNASAAIARVLRPPRREMDAWLIVGKDDSLTEDVAPWIRERGYRAFKLKILGSSVETDVERTVEVFRTAQALGAAKPRLAVDSNCANPDAASVLDYLQRLRARDPAAFAALEYVEQPTGRDIRQYPNDWRAVTRHKPVLLDEGLTDFDVFEEAVAQGWSGFALKTCKGHSFTLVAAAWAQARGLLLAMQDLTNPGYAAIHAALLAAHLPTINGVELNAAQYTPEANADWLPHLSSLLEPRDGTHRLPQQPVIGLGTQPAFALTSTGE